MHAPALSLARPHAVPCAAACCVTQRATHAASARRVLQQSCAPRTAGTAAGALCCAGVRRRHA
eukprot:1150391-Pelagomonas_calceolata.AAC.9